MASTHEGHYTAETQVQPEHDAGAFPPFDPANFAPLLIWLAISFAALYFLMSKIALPRVHDILTTRQAKINEDLKNANKMRAEAKDAAAAHDKMIADARAKAQTLAQETHTRLNAETDAKRHTLEADLNAKLVAAEAQIADTKAKAMSNVEAIAQDAAAAIIQHLTGKPADTAAVAAAFATTKA
jgi:F-type H+-transporting ATPase subunit b